MKKILLYLAVAMQILSVAWIAASREIILLTGEPVLIQTAPIDPRDIFRGDYVSLSYTFNKIQPEMFDTGLKGQDLAKGHPVYLSLKVDKHNIASAERLLAHPPAEGLFLKGRVKHNWKYPNATQKNLHTNPVNVNFGIEKYFVQQGKGLEIEKIRGLHDSRRERFQRPMLMQVRIDSQGNAGLNGFAWGKLGYKTDVIKSGDSKAADNEASAIIRFSIKNLSDQPVTLPLKPGNCSFDLRPSAYNFDETNQLKNGRPQCLNATAKEITLAKGDVHDIEFDLNNPAWRFDHGIKTAVPLGRLPWGYRMRIHYAGEAVPELKAEIISRAFHGRGQID